MAKERNNGFAGPDIALQKPQHAGWRAKIGIDLGHRGFLGTSERKGRAAAIFSLIRPSPWLARPGERRIFARIKASANWEASNSSKASRIRAGACGAMLAGVFGDALPVVPRRKTEGLEYLMPSCHATPARRGFWPAPHRSPFRATFERAPRSKDRPAPPAPFWQNLRCQAHGLGARSGGARPKAPACRKSSGSRQRQALFDPMVIGQKEDEEDVAGLILDQDLVGRPGAGTRRPVLDGLNFERDDCIERCIGDFWPVAAVDRGIGEMEKKVDRAGLPGVLHQEPVEKLGCSAECRAGSRLSRRKD